MQTQNLCVLCVSVVKNNLIRLPEGEEGHMWSKLHKYRTKLWHRLLKNDVVAIDQKIVRYGSATGGWHIPSELIKPEWLVYDFGVGDDISFDIALVERHGCTIHAFDPTPESVAFMDDKSLPGFQFHPVGVWDSDTSIKFWLPSNVQSISYSADNLRRSSAFVEVPVKTINTIATELGHQHIDFIKMDVNGAEQRVIPDMFADGFRPMLLCLEYDMPYKAFTWLSLKWFLAGLRLHRAIRDAGYQLISKNGRNATYLLNDKA